jgi:hypothetical protein
MWAETKRTPNRVKNCHSLTSMYRRVRNGSAEKDGIPICDPHLSYIIDFVGVSFLGRAGAMSPPPDLE